MYALADPGGFCRGFKTAAQPPLGCPQGEQLRHCVAPTSIASLGDCFRAPKSTRSTRGAQHGTLLHTRRGSPAQLPYPTSEPAPSNPACAQVLHCTALVLLHQPLHQWQREARSLERRPQSVLPAWHPRCSRAERRVQQRRLEVHLDNHAEQDSARRRCKRLLLLPASAPWEGGGQTEPDPSQRCLGTDRGAAGTSCSRGNSDKEKILPLRMVRPWDRTQGGQSSPSLERRKPRPDTALI